MDGNREGGKKRLYKLPQQLDRVFYQRKNKAATPKKNTGAAVLNNFLKFLSSMEITWNFSLFISYMVPNSEKRNCKLEKLQNDENEIGVFIKFG